MKWIQDLATGELIPADQYRRRLEALHYVQADLAPYQSMITWRPIEGRKAHREHLAAHGCREVEPSEAPSWMRERQYERRHRND